MKLLCLGETLSLATTASGHYCIPIYQTILQDDSGAKGKIILSVTATFQSMMQLEKRRKAKTLHVQFAHASKERLLKLIANAELEDEVFKMELESVCEECEGSAKYKKASLRPFVGLPLANIFNHVVCLKVYVHNKTWILHMIDSSTKYSAARPIHTKKDEEIVKNIYLTVNPLISARGTYKILRFLRGALKRGRRL